jgi:NAD-dependent dihydropyrimidine dehydrogenase PreA subunit
VCALNTLVYDVDLCVGCNMCSIVCPHGVFSPAEPIHPGSKQLAARLLHPEECMECGACALNCLTRAITVESGVGCASAMIVAALTGKEVSCGGSGCCSTSTTSSRAGTCSTSGTVKAACCSGSELSGGSSPAPAADRTCGCASDTPAKSAQKTDC